MDININTEPTINDKIVRQNCLTHADAWFNTLPLKEKSVETYFKFAEVCEIWVNRKK
jgi:hypothetical protein